MTRLCRQRGFSLQEVLVAILIAGILGAIALPTMKGQRSTSSNSEARVTLLAARDALQEYWTDYGVWEGLGPDPDGAGPKVGSPTVSGEYREADYIKRDYTWTTSTVTPTSSPAPQTVHINTADDQTLIICNASKEFVYCVSDKDDKVTYGAAIDVAGTAEEATAASRAAATSPAGLVACQDTVGKAEQYARNGNC